MNYIFKTFYCPMQNDDLNEIISNFAKDHAYIEVARSAPTLCVDTDAMFIAVTSTFSVDPFKTENEENSNQVWTSVDEAIKVNERCYNTDAFDD